MKGPEGNGSDTRSENNGTGNHDTKAPGLNEAAIDQVIQSIAKAESVTSAEIFAVFTRRSDDYRFVGYTMMALWIFIVSAFLAAYLVIDGGGILFSEDGNSGSWWRGQFNLQLFILAQIAAFVCGIVLMRFWPTLAVKVTPRRIVRERAHANGVKQFLAHGIHHTSGRTGVLIFVSLEERHGEILVDRAVEEKIGRSFFLDTVALLVEDCARGEIGLGYIRAIDVITPKLAEHFPPHAGDTNEIEDRFVIV